MKIKDIALDGVVRQNPTLRLVLGTCPTLAVTTVAFDSFGMGLAVTFVLICSNIIISLLRNIIPDQVRIPAYITVIAAFVTIVQLLIQAYSPALDKSLGIFLPLIVVNCIILGRAEMFASKNKPLDSALDGLGMGLGFTITLVVMASIREIVGSGSWFGMTIIPESIDRFTFMTTPAGGFFTFGILMALVIWLEEKLGKKVDRSIGCEGWPSKGACKGGCD